jgi:hypothetical protein
MLLPRQLYHRKANIAWYAVMVMCRCVISVILLKANFLWRVSRCGCQLRCCYKVIPNNVVVVDVVIVLLLVLHGIGGEWDVMFELLSWHVAGNLEDISYLFFI